LTYYAAKTRAASARPRRDEELTALIEQIHAENYGVYGARKIWHELRRRGVPVARRTVERLMPAVGLRGLLRDKTPRTTRPAAETSRPATLRLPHRATLVLAMAVFAAGHVLAALSSSFALVLTAPVVTALVTGAFWSGPQWPRPPRGPGPGVECARGDDERRRSGHRRRGATRCLDRTALGWRARPTLVVLRRRPHGPAEAPTVSAVRLEGRRFFSVFSSASVYVPGHGPPRAMACSDHPAYRCRRGWLRRTEGVVRLGRVGSVVLGRRGAGDVCDGGRRDPERITLWAQGGRHVLRVR
jgi:hypothetical protein